MGRELRGVIPAVITPFTADEQVDEPAFRKVLNLMVDHGVHGLFPVGTGGEFSALTLDEKKRLTDVAVKEVAGRAFVMPNVGAITTAESVVLARHAEAVGCDAVSAVTPFFLKPSQDELFEHYRTICAAVKLPVLAYNIPERTGGVALSVATVARLAREVPNFAGIKDSTGDLSNSVEFLQATPSGFRVFMGRDTLIFGALLYGCAGAVAATAPAHPYSSAPKISVSRPMKTRNPGGVAWRNSTELLRSPVLSLIPAKFDTSRASRATVATLKATPPVRSGIL